MLIHETWMTRRHNVVIIRTKEKEKVDHVKTNARELLINTPELMEREEQAVRIKYDIEQRKRALG